MSDSCEKARDLQQRLDALVAGGAAQPLGTLAGFTVSLATWRVNGLGYLVIDIAVTGGSTNLAAVNFSVTLPSAARPASNKNLELTGARAIVAGDPIARAVITAGGVVSVNTPASNTNFWAGTGLFPLDS